MAFNGLLHHITLLIMGFLNSAGDIRFQESCMSNYFGIHSSNKPKLESNASSLELSLVFERMVA